MIRRVFPGLVLIGVAVWWWVQKSETREDSVSDQQKYEQQKLRVVPKPRGLINSAKTLDKREIEPEQKKKKKVTPLKKSAGRAVWPKIADANKVRFEVVNGYALAYGDIVLGKVKSGGGKYGFHQPETSKLWPSKRIAYAIDKKVTNRSSIEQAIRYFNENTVMEFVPYKDEEDALVFLPFEKNCASYLGRTAGHQPIFLAPDCGRDEIIHELMHALGFVHEQSREERNQFVQVLYENIDEEYENQFDIIPDFLIHDYRGSVFHFDYESIMMYLPTAFAREPGLKTMRSLTSTPIPRTKSGLSRTDIDRLYYLYGP